MPSSSLRALSKGTLASTNVHKPFVKSKRSLFVTFLRRILSTFFFDSFILIGVRFFPFNILMASLSDSALT